MLKDSIIHIYERDLNKLKDEINLYKREENLWKVEKAISNSAGNLCLHLIGNSKHFVGAVLGGSGYERKRDAEFAGEKVSRAALLAEIDETIDVVKKSLEKLSDEDLERDFPVEKHGETKKTNHMLLHLLAHLNYHLGQINYHRRLIDAA